jgi:hypothetical protein
VFEALAKRYGYKLRTYSVPGKSMADQRSQWRKIVRAREDWMIMWGWGQMNSTAIQRASEVGFPVNRFIGVWWSGSETDVVPNGKAAIGYRAATLHETGTGFPVHADILKYVYKGDVAAAKKNNFGEVLYNRALLNALLHTEAVRYAILKHGKTVTGEAAREGLEHMNLTAARLKALGMEGFTRPFSVPTTKATDCCAFSSGTARSGTWSVAGSRRTARWFARWSRRLRSRSPRSSNTRNVQTANKRVRRSFAGRRPHGRPAPNSGSVSRKPDRRNNKTKNNKCAVGAGLPPARPNRENTDERTQVCNRFDGWCDDRRADDGDTSRSRCFLSRPDLSNRAVRTGWHTARERCARLVQAAQRA